jgi:hypothetical protein
MNDEYRFRRPDEADPAASEMTMVCLDDEAALLLAERLAMGGPVEVWTHERLVGLIPGDAPAAPGQAAAPAEPPAAAPAPRRFKPFWAGAWRRGAQDS